MAPKIDEYKNRMTAPIGAIRVNPKTGKPIPKSDTKKVKRK